MGLLIIVSFISAIIGTMIGSAMLILPPTMIFLGMPVHIAIATARFSMLGIAIGNLTKFSLKEKVEFRYVLPFALAGVLGSFASASFMTKVDEGLLKAIVGILMIAISFLILAEDYVKPKGKKKKATIVNHLLSVIAGLFIGAYIGLIGGGGATLIIFLLVLIYGLGYRAALVNQKAVTLPISIVTTIVFVYQGLIDYKIGLPLLLTNVAGGWVGAGFILKFKNTWLKRILVPVIVLMAIKLIFF